VSYIVGFAKVLGIALLLLAIVCVIGYVWLGALTVDWRDE
jgi:hypothetical protein